MAAGWKSPRTCIAERGGGLTNFAPLCLGSRYRPCRLPSPDAVARWDSDRFATSLRHDAACEAYNPHFRQFLHVGYKVAAEMGSRFTAALEQHADVIARNVTETSTPATFGRCFFFPDVVGQTFLSAERRRQRRQTRMPAPPDMLLAVSRLRDREMDANYSHESVRRDFLPKIFCGEGNFFPKTNSRPSLLANSIC